ncbi:MAG: hypothetical protein WDN69_19565 [Aliidongia sp.]
MPAEQQQQRIAGHDRRQHQRQIDHGSEQRPAAKPPACQHIGDDDGERQGARNGPEANPQAERQRGVFDRCQHGAALRRFFRRCIRGHETASAGGGSIESIR